MSTEFWTILGVGVAVIGLNWRMYEGLRRDISDIRGEIADLRERMARVEGMLEAMRDFLIGNQITPSLAIKPLSLRGLPSRTPSSLHGLLCEKNNELCDLGLTFARMQQEVFSYFQIHTVDFSKITACR